MNVETRIEPDELKREIDLILSDIFIAGFESDELNTEITFLNGQKFVVTLKEVV